MDWSLVISIVALASSSISPFASAWLSGHYRIKEKQMDLQAAAQRHRWEYYEQHRAEVIERYMSIVGRWLQFDTIEATEDLGTVLGEIYLYVDQSLWPTLDVIAAGLGQDPNAQLRQTFRDLCKALVDYNVRAKDEPQPGNAKKRKV